MVTRRLAAALESMNAFPVTPFGEDGAFAPELFQRVLALVGTGRPGAVFTGCGTGEFWSLSLDERVAVADVAIETLEGRLPVIVGWAGSDPASRRVVRTLAGRGVAGLLMMSPAPWAWDGQGVADYYHSLLQESGLPGIVYLKDTGGHDPDWWVETINNVGAAGIKDGIGDPDFLTGLIAAGLDARRIVNGTPTAELVAHTYWAAGVRGYSSAVLNFAPELARTFCDALLAQDEQTIRNTLRKFFRPLRTLCAQQPSYAVSLMKAGAHARGIPVGSPRPPLSWPDEAACRRIAELTAAAGLLASPASSRPAVG